MRQSPRHNAFYFFLGLALASGAVVSQPISPTSDVKSTLTTNPTTPVLDLPYKPIENPAEEVGPMGPDGLPLPVDENVDPNALPATVAGSEPEKKYTFENIPYLALKYPAVKALPDPN